jgi:uncharacterized protein involved in exopolysaccharide biosynthesis
MSETQTAELPERLSSSLVQDESIDILDILLVLARDRRRIAVVTLGFLLLGAAVSFLLLKPTFTATATILPPQQQQSSASAMLGQLSSLAGLGGAGGLLKNPADIYVAMITSRTDTDRLIGRFHLQTVYKTKTMDDTRKAFKAHVTAELTKDGLIEINVKDHDPRRASDLANGLVGELYHLTSTLAITEAAQRRLFFYQQMQDEEAALAAAEEDLKKTQEKTGLIQLSDQAAEIIRNVANLRAQIVGREVELQATRTYATDQNPDVTRLQQEIGALQQQLTTMENNQRRMQPGNIQVPTAQVPEAGLEYANKLREVTFHTALLTLLSKEYEAARIDEAKSAPLIQVIDHAVPPDKRSGPPRALLTLAAGFLGFVGASFWAFVRNTLKRIEQIPENAQKLKQLRTALRRGAAAKAGSGYDE